MRIPPAGAGAKQLRQYRTRANVVSQEPEAYHTGEKILNARDDILAVSLPSHCAILLAEMKLLFAIVVVVLISLSALADYQWRTWMAERKRERDTDPDRRT